jgi:hypothetical protein
MRRLVWMGVLQLLSSHPQRTTEAWQPPIPSLTRHPGRHASSFATTTTTTCLSLKKTRGKRRRSFGNRHSGEHDVPDDGDQAARAMEEQWTALRQHDYDGGVTAQSFNMDLSNLAAADPRQAQDALEVMYDLHQQQQVVAMHNASSSPRSSATTTASTTNTRQRTILPDARCYATVVDGYVQAGQPAAAQAALDLLEERFPWDGNTTTSQAAAAVDPVAYSYMLVAQAWADDYRGDFLGTAADRAEALLQRMHDRGRWPPQVKIWSIVLEGWCKRTGIARTALHRADALLSQMEDSYRQRQQQQGTHPAPPSETSLTPSSRDLPSGGTTTTRSTRLVAPPPNIVTYTSYIGGLARSKDRELARKAEATLVRMREYGVTPDVVAYTSVLNCWSRAISRRERELAASRALRILDEMERTYSRGANPHAKPNHITYAAAIKAIGNSYDPAAPQLAEDVLRRMYQLSSKGSGGLTTLKPTTSTWNAVLNALSRAVGDSKVRYARRAEQLLAEMQQRAAGKEADVRPDVRTWAAVLRAWSMSGDPQAGENCQRILDNLEALYEKKETNIRPNYVCYTTCMGAWGNSKRKDALNCLEGILKKMETDYEETQEADIRPNTISYVTAIDAFVRNNEYNAADRAQATVDRMMRLYSKGLGHVRPTKIVFNTLIHAWSKSRQHGAALRAEKIFKLMEAQYQEGDDLVRPDEVSLCAVLNAWANQAENGGAKRAQQILDHMQSLSLERRGFHLSIMMPNIVIKAIARSGDEKAVRQAEAILQKLESDYIFDKSSLKPDVTTYSSVINSCAYYRHPQGRAEAMEVALRTYHKLCDLEDDGPNNITFGTLFKAISKLMPQSKAREDLVADLFDQCCEKGTVDRFVLSQVRNASPQLYRDLVEEPCGLGGPESDTSIPSVLRNMPAEWCLNYC